MLKKIITYTNPFTNKEVTEEHYFHISKADLIEMQMENVNEPEVTDPTTGRTLEGFPAKLQRIINDKDGNEVLSVVKDMVRRAYGKKEGDRFVRSKEIWEEFMSTEAWAQLYFELCTDAVAQADFMNGIFPSDMLAEANKLASAQTTSTSEQTTSTSEVKRETDNGQARLLSNADVVEMDSGELKSGLATGKYKLS
jgi:hypothetical protein